MCFDAQEIALRSGCLIHYAFPCVSVSADVVIQLSFFLFACMVGCVCVCVRACVCLSVCLAGWLAVRLAVRLSGCVSLCLFVCEATGHVMDISIAIASVAALLREGAV